MKTVKSLLLSFLLLVSPCYAAYEFAGSSDYIQDESAFSDESVSASFWMYAHTDKNTGLIDSEAGFDLDQRTTWTLRVYRPYSTTPMIRQCNNNSITQNTWHHVFVEYSGGTSANSYHIYIDGTECSYALSQNGSGAIALPPLPHYLRIGYQNFDGAITEFAMWGNVNFAANDIAQLNQRVKYMPLALKSQVANLKVYYPLHEDPSALTAQTRDMYRNKYHMISFGTVTQIGEHILTYP